MDNTAKLTVSAAVVSDEKLDKGISILASMYTDQYTVQQACGLLNVNYKGEHGEYVSALLLFLLLSAVSLATSL